MKNWPSLVFTFIFSLTAVHVHAEWVRVEASAVVYDGQVHHAKERARAQLIEDAKSQFRQQQMDQIDVGRNGLAFPGSDHLLVRSVDIVDEQLWSNQIFLTAQVNIELAEPQSMCAVDVANDYKKSLAVMGFTVQVPQEASIGGIQLAGAGLSQAVREVLSGDPSLLVLGDSRRALYHDASQAPTRYLQEASLTNSIEAAQDLGVQFLVSGVIRDMGLYDEQSQGRSYWERIKIMAGAVDTRRRFAVDLFLHDGLTGAIISENRYSVVADWEPSNQDALRFGSISFWQSSYGKAIAVMMQDLRVDIAEQVRCQPFMARIARVEGKTLHFAAGALAGIKPGDKLQVYRTHSFYDANLYEGTSLKNARTILTVSQVHPDFASGKIGVEPQRVNIQEDDLVVAW